MQPHVGMRREKKKENEHKMRSLIHLCGAKITIDTHVL